MVVTSQQCFISGVGEGRSSSSVIQNSEGPPVRNFRVEKRSLGNRLKRVGLESAGETRPSRFPKPADPFREHGIQDGRGSALRHGR